MSFALPLVLTGIEDAENLDGQLKLDLVGTVLAGPKGARGERGYTGEKGEPGESPDLSIGSVVTGDPTDPVSIEMVGNFPNYALNFIIPKGMKGDTGETGAQGPQGLPGTGTATVYRSPDLPPNNVGEDGDIWFVLK